MKLTTGIPRTQSRKRSIAIVLYLTVATMCLSQVTYDVSANELAEVEDTLSSNTESHEQTTTSELNRPENSIEDTTRNTAGKRHSLFSLSYRVSYFM
uniref:Uncharacterized protein n=1 Tax=Babesia bovis TaxID=5865 RepID=S6CAI6_BABBO|nr:hypothetical protein [Babesia bovis]